MKIFLVQLVAMTLVAVCYAKKNKDCVYKRSAKWSECLDNRQTMSKALDESKSKGTSCEKVLTKSRSCVPGRKEKCKYTKGNWSDCDESNDMQTRLMTLQKGGQQCQLTKTKTRKCKKGCKYTKGSWGLCDPSTKRMSRTLTLQQGGNHCQGTKIREKKCKKNKSGRKGKSKNRRTRLVKKSSSVSTAVLPSHNSSSSASSSSLTSTATYSTVKLRSRPVEVQSRDLKSQSNFQKDSSGIGLQKKMMTMRSKKPSRSQMRSGKIKKQPLSVSMSSSTQAFLDTTTTKCSSWQFYCKFKKYMAQKTQASKVPVSSTSVAPSTTESLDVTTTTKCTWWYPTC